MMKKLMVFSLIGLMMSCGQSPKKTDTATDNPTPKREVLPQKEGDQQAAITLTLENAQKLAELPLACVQQEYPNKLDHLITGAEAIKTPKQLHPAFYGCLDWHSSVHAHWSLVYLLKAYPAIKQSEEIKSKLLDNMSRKNILQEVAYFKKKSNKGSERPYGWAWLLKLAEELHTWHTPLGDTLETRLQPLTDVIVSRFKAFLPKLTAPIRVGQHANTAFALVFAYDYAVAVGDEALKQLVVSRTKHFYLEDTACPLAYEPGGASFLSPCLEEVNIMQRVLAPEKFKAWLKDFLPQLFKPDFKMAVGKVKDPTDGKLVHLYGVNFSRAWVFYDLANKLDTLSHLKSVGDQHFRYSFQHIIDGQSYMGSHWLGTFALYALDRRK